MINSVVDKHFWSHFTIVSYNVGSRHIACIILRCTSPIDA